MTNSPRSSYTGVAIGLHWLVAFLIFATFALGLVMTELPFSPQKLKYYSWHKWSGVTIFLLALLRLAWRGLHAPPPPPAGIPAWQNRLAAWVHRGLYFLIFAVPLSGWLMSSAKGVPTVYFGVWPLPDLINKNAALGDRLLQLHIALNVVMASLVILHAAAALKHHLFDRDDVLRRMLPFQ